MCSKTFFGPQSVPPATRMRRRGPEWDQVREDVLADALDEEVALPHEKERLVVTSKPRAA